MAKSTRSRAGASTATATTTTDSADDAPLPKGKRLPGKLTQSVSLGGVRIDPKDRRSATTPGRTYVAGNKKDEAELAQVLTKEQIDTLTEKGVLVPHDDED